MNFEEFAARFRKIEQAVGASAQAPGRPAGEVTLAGTVLSVTDDGCRLDINGAQYDVSRGDITDVQLLAAALGKGAGEEGAEADEITSAHVVLFKVKGDAVLHRWTPLQAGLVAAAGTWISVAPVAKEAPRDPPGERDASV